MPRVTSSISSLFGGTKRATFLLVEIDNDFPIRYTSCDQPIVATIESVSRTFIPNYVAVSGLGTDSQRGTTECTVQVQNVDKVVAGIILSAEGIRGRRVQIWEAWFDPTSNAYVDSIKLMDGRADSATFDEKNSTFRVVPHDVPWVLATPGAAYGPSCVNKFKGSLCQYAGTDTNCRRDWADCTSKGNTQNYNGHRFLPDGTKKYFWRSIQRQLPTR